MIESKFTFFEMKVEGSFMNPSETGQPSFRMFGLMAQVLGEGGQR